MVVVVDASLAVVVDIVVGQLVVAVVVVEHRCVRLGRNVVP